MAVYEVKLQKTEDKTFYDTNSTGIMLTPKFISRITEATKTRKNYKTSVVGITEVKTAGSVIGGSSFFILEINKKQNKCELLFEILSGESSKLLGVHPNTVKRDEIKTLIMDVSNYHLNDNVFLLI